MTKITEACGTAEKLGKLTYEFCGFSKQYPSHYWGYLSEKTVLAGFRSIEANLNNSLLEIREAIMRFEYRSAKEREND